MAVFYNLCQAYVSFSICLVDSSRIISTEQPILIKLLDLGIVFIFNQLTLVNSCCLMCLMMVLSIIDKTSPPIYTTTVDIFAGHQLRSNGVYWTVVAPFKSCGSQILRL